MYDPGSDSYPDSCSLEHSYRAMFAHPSGQMGHTHSAQSFHRSALPALCRVLIGYKNVPVEDVVMMYMYTICQQGLTVVVDFFLKEWFRVTIWGMNYFSLNLINFLFFDLALADVCMKWNASSMGKLCWMDCYCCTRPERIDYVRILYMYTMHQPLKFDLCCCNVCICLNSVVLTFIMSWKA